MDETLCYDSMVHPSASWSGSDALEWGCRWGTRDKPAKKNRKKGEPMKIKITILCENTVGHRIGSGEHGFSAFIETDKGNCLFDTGSGHSIVANSLSLNKDLKSIKKRVLKL